MQTHGGDLTTTQTTLWHHEHSAGSGRSADRTPETGVVCSWGLRGSHVGHQCVFSSALRFSIGYAGEQGGRAGGDQGRIVESRVGVLG